MLRSGVDTYVQELGQPKSLARALALATAQGNTAQDSRIADFLRRLHLMLNDSAYRDHFFKSISIEALASLLLEPPVSNDWLNALQSTQLLPTPQILAFAARNGASASSGLQWRVAAASPDDFVSAVQEYMRAKIREWLR